MTVFLVEGVHKILLYDNLIVYIELNYDLRYFILAMRSGRNWHMFYVRTFVILFTKEVVPRHQIGNEEYMGLLLKYIFSS